MLRDDARQHELKCIRLVEMVRLSTLSICSWDPDEKLILEV